MAKNWADAPSDVLGVIIKRLCVADIYSFMEVCHPWYAAVREAKDLSLLSPPPLSSPPWLTIYPKAKVAAAAAHFETNGPSFFDLANKKLVYFVENNTNSTSKKKWQPPHPKEAVQCGSSQGWFAFIDFHCGIYLVNPLKSSKDESSSMILLPPIETLPCIREVASRSSSCTHFVWYHEYYKKTTTESSIDMYGIFIRKLVMTPNSLSCSDDFTVMILYDSRCNIAICRSGDTSWTALEVKTEFNDDLYYSICSQQLYLASLGDTFEIWDLRDFSSPKSTYVGRLPEMTSERLRLDDYSYKLYLVNLDGDLLFVRRLVARMFKVDDQTVVEFNGDAVDANGRYTSENALPYKTVCFLVYKRDWVNNEWVQINCLGKQGDGVLFLGINNAMTFSALDFPNLQGNSIYFTDDYVYCYEYLLTEASPYGGHDLGIFNLTDNSIQPCYYAGDCNRISSLPSWISPNPF